MTKEKSIAGERNGYVVALERCGFVEYAATKVPAWKFVCDCGKEFVTRKDSFVKGAVTSCGCKGVVGRPEIGDKVNSWTVLSTTVRKGRTYYICACDCGTEGVVSLTDLMKNKSTKCVGCGFVRYGGEEYGQASRNKLYGIYKNNAANNGREFEISMARFVELIVLPCEYCMSPPRSIFKTPGGHILYNGLDRKHNNMGYIEANIAVCCSVCNRAKQSMPYDEWMDWLNGFKARLIDE